LCSKSGKTDRFFGVLDSSAKDETELDKRSKIATILMAEISDDFVKQQKSRKRLRFIFFGATLLSIAFIFVLCIYLLFFAREGDRSFEQLATLIGSVGALTTALMILPKTAATYLFNKEDGNYIRDLLVKIVETDSVERREREKIKSESALQEERPPRASNPPPKDLDEFTNSK